MHVAIFGAGALGSVYGVRLAVRAGATVTFIVRPSRVDSRAPIVIERVVRGRSGSRAPTVVERVVRGRSGSRDGREVIASPARSASVPADADVVMLAVGTEDLEAIRPVLDATHAPVVVLTPMMPRDFERMRGAFGDRVLAAMPSVVAYANDEGVVRYWLPPAPTRIDEPRAGDAGDAVRALAVSLTEAGVRTHLELGVHETNPATTVCFIPVGMGVALAGSLEALARDVELLELVRRACFEGVALARSIGKPEPLSPLAPFAASRLVLRAAVAFLERRSPEALHYVDVHFGRKLRAQHLEMADAMVDLAIDKRIPHEAIADLASRLRHHAG